MDPDEFEAPLTSTPIGATLEERIEIARRETDQALADLRAVMSDDAILETFGIDVQQLGPDRP